MFFPQVGLISAKQYIFFILKVVHNLAMRRAGPSGSASPSARAPPRGLGVKHFGLPSTQLKRRWGDLGPLIQQRGQPVRVSVGTLGFPQEPLPKRKGNLTGVDASDLFNELLETTAAGEVGDLRAASVDELVQRTGEPLGSLGVLGEGEDVHDVDGVQLPDG